MIVASENRLSNRFAQCYSPAIARISGHGFAESRLAALLVNGQPNGPVLVVLQGTQPACAAIRWSAQQRLEDDLFAGVEICVLLCLWHRYCSPENGMPFTPISIARSVAEELEGANSELDLWDTKFDEFRGPFPELVCSSRRWVTQAEDALDRMPDIKPTGDRKSNALREAVRLVVGAFTALLHHSNRGIQVAAAQCLGRLGQHANDAIEPLARCFENDSERFFEARAGALAKIDKSAGPETRRIFHRFYNAFTNPHATASDALWSFEMSAELRRELIQIGEWRAQHVDAEDAFSETLLSLATRLENKRQPLSFRDAHDFKRYVFRAYGARTLNIVTRRPQGLKSPGVDVARVQGSPNSELFAARREFMALYGHTPEAKAFDFRFFYGMTGEEIGEKLGVHVRKAQRLAAKGRQMFEDFCRDQGYWESS